MIEDHIILEKENVNKLMGNFIICDFIVFLQFGKQNKMLKSYEILTDISGFTIYLSSNMNDKIEMYQKLYTYGIFRLSSPGLSIKSYLFVIYP